MNALQRYRRHIPFLVLLAILSLVVTREDGKERPLSGQWVEMAPAMPTPDADFLQAGGGRARLADYRGKPVLLNLWASWCAPCIKEMPSLAALERDYAARGLVVLPISIERTQAVATLEAFLRDYSAGYPSQIGVDDSGAIAKALMAQGLPVSYLITREGRITHRFIGAADWENPAPRAVIEAAF